MVTQGTLRGTPELCVSQLRPFVAAFWGWQLLLQAAVGFSDFNGQHTKCILLSILLNLLLKFSRMRLHLANFGTSWNQSHSRTPKCTLRTIY